MRTRTLFSLGFWIAGCGQPGASPDGALPDGGVAMRDGGTLGDALMNGLLGTGGALHAAELPFVFGNFPGPYTPDADDLVVSAAMQRAWTSFARDHAPDYEPAWSRSTSASPSIAIIEDPSDVTGDIRSGRCAELRRIGLVR